jgi:hypothetical protein
MRLTRVPAFISVIALLLTAGEAFSDTIHMKNGRRLDGRIVEVRESNGAIESIRIRVGGALVTVPGSDIDRYEDESEPTETPTPRPTNTPAPTDTPKPTNSPTPRPTPTPGPRIVPPTIPPRDSEPAQREPVFWEEPEGFDQSDEWDDEPPWGFGEEDEFVFGDEEGMPTPEELKQEFLQAGVPVIVLAILHVICIMIVWVLCLMDSLDKGWEMVVVVALFGFPCCSCIASLVLLGYVRTKYDGESEGIANTLITVALGLGFVIYLILRFHN